MQCRTWISLLRRIPTELQDFLVFVTSIGTEISVQSILRMEDEYIVVRGRLAGTTDVGRVFFIPLADINHVLIQKEMKETEIQALYEQPLASAPKGVSANGRSLRPPVEKQIEPEANAAPTPEPQPSAETPSEPASPPKSTRSSPRLPIPSKEAILERLRARVRSGGKSSHR
jgi:hypothetical protein